MTHAERDRLIQQYAEGPALLRAAWASVPAAARQWRHRVLAAAPYEVFAQRLAALARA